MTDITEKNVSSVLEISPNNPDEFTMTDEEWEAFLDRACGIGEPEKKIEMKCIKCGYKEKVPAWIVGEFTAEDKILGKKDQTALECPRCNGAMYRVE